LRLLSSSVTSCRAARMQLRHSVLRASSNDVWSAWANGSEALESHVFLGFTRRLRSNNE